MTRFKVGDRVRVIKPYPPLQHGEVYTVLRAYPDENGLKAHTGTLEIANSGVKAGHWCMSRFELVEEKPSVEKRLSNENPN